MELSGKASWRRRLSLRGIRACIPFRGKRMNRAHTTGHVSMENAVPAGESKCGYGRLSRNKSMGLRFRVRSEELWEI